MSETHSIQLHWTICHYSYHIIVAVSKRKCVNFNIFIVNYRNWFAHRKQR